MNTRTLSIALATAFLVVAAPLSAMAAKPAAAAKPAVSAKAAGLFNNNGCVACHGLGAKDAAKMGPSFAAVAKKYPNNAANITKLAKKIRAGGAGSFGTIPMPPMTQVSEADATELAKYALSFKGK